MYAIFAILNSLVAIVFIGISFGLVLHVLVWHVYQYNCVVSYSIIILLVCLHNLMCIHDIYMEIGALLHTNVDVIANSYVSMRGFICDSSSLVKFLLCFSLLILRLNT